MAADIDLRKREIRAEVRERRGRISDEQRAAALTGFTEQIVRLVEARDARSATCYLPVGAEPDPRGFIASAREEGIDLLFPSSREDGLLDWIRPSWEGSVTGKFGISEPLGEHLSPLAAADVDLMLIPACAVDRGGMRLGWGRGYFDRTLGSLDRRPPVFAIVYDEELLDHVPRDVHDIPVTGVVTPTRITYLDEVSDPDSLETPYN